MLETLSVLQRVFLCTIRYSSKAMGATTMLPKPYTRETAKVLDMKWCRLLHRAQVSQKEAEIVVLVYVT